MSELFWAFGDALPLIAACILIGVTAMAVLYAIWWLIWGEDRR